MTALDVSFVVDGESDFELVDPLLAVFETTTPTTTPTMMSTTTAASDPMT